jgi:hypothetical protein
MGVLYEADLYAWTKAQADALRRRAANEIDWENLAEEIESVGNSDRRAIESRLKILLIHLLKWRYQPEHRSDSWRSSIDEARYRIARIIDDSPSLNTYPGEAMADAYRMAIINKTIRRLELYHLPQECPWTIEQVLDPDFLP